MKRLGILLSALLFAGLAAAVPLSAQAQTGRPAGASPLSLKKVTLITGDVVDVVTHGDGKRAISLEPGPNGLIPDAAITRAGAHLYVVPRSALRLLSARRLDSALFDVNTLIKYRYDNAHRSTLPVIVDYGNGARAAATSRTVSLAGARKTVALSALGAAAFAADKRHARTFWRSLTAGPGALADGAVHVYLDGRVHATAGPSVEQIHAPQAWAAGFDGSGAKVAVLDTGYDPTHPDLVGRVSSTSNFTTDPGVVDGNGHGTHVASTIAGSGAASGGLYEGVAPGVSLMVGKVLGNDGMGDDSWVLAGMQWAVANGADVVNMSLGGEPGDGTDLLSQAIDDLSAKSKTLFVVAAGNDGSDPGTITDPGAADAALTVGAVDSSDSMAYFSSRGPRPGDGALKPDVVAPGVGIVAARAAGTSLGSPVDEWYTSLDGTSMATPHVAGVAAILEQEHPTWDGEQIKAAITGSAVPVTGATAFDAGTGRVDALRAIEATVVANGPLNLGSYPYPQSNLPPTQTPLTYTNLGSNPVTLNLSVAAEDPAAPAPAGVTLSASQVTVAAGDTATVDVDVDPSAAGVGNDSGVVVADGPGSLQVRTAFALSLESEHYNLSVEVDPRAGTQSADHSVALVGLNSGSYDQRQLSGPGPQSVTFRVPPGDYSVGAVTFGLGAGGGHVGVLAYQPVIHLAADAKVVLDERSARKFSHANDRPVTSDGQIMSVSWATAAGGAGFMLAGSADRLFATPMTSTPDLAIQSSLNWLLAQPAALLRFDAGAKIPLEPVASPGQQPWAAPTPDLSGRFRIVDAGSTAAVRTAGVRGSIAVVAGQCDDLADAANSLAAAGAAAMVAYAGHGSQCAGTLGSPTALPAFQARPYAAARLLSLRPREARIETHASPSYIYDLAGAWQDRVPAGAVLDGVSRHLAAYVEDYSSLGGTSAQGHHVWDMRIGWIPWSGSAAYGLIRPVAVPSTVTHYESPVAHWERLVEVQTSDGADEGILDAPQRAVSAGQTIHDRWFGGPITSRVSPLTADQGWQGSPYRQGDYLWLALPSFVDSAGHTGFPFYTGEFNGKLYVDGQLTVEGDDPFWMQYFADSGRHDYELVYSTDRSSGFWQGSTKTETDWRFSSQQPAGDHEVLPLIQADWDLPLSSTNTARPGPFSFGVRFRFPPEADPSPIRRARVDISWNGGSTWTGADAHCKNAACTVRVRNLHSGSASLRVTAVDAAGRSLTQTIIDAYQVP